MTGLSAAHALLIAITGQATPEVTSIIHHGEPVPKARARWSGKSRGFYTPDRTHYAQQALEWKFKAAMRGRATHTSAVAIVALFFRPTRARIDTDNLMKLVMDAGTRAHVWLDDSQVTAQAALMELDPTDPRTVIAFCPYQNALVVARAPKPKRKKV